MTESYEKWCNAANNNLILEFKKTYNREIKQHCKNNSLRRGVYKVISDENSEIVFERRIQHIIDADLIESCALLKDVYMHYFGLGLINFDSNLELIFIYHNYIRPIDDEELKTHALNILINCSNNIDDELRHEFKLGFVEYKLSKK